MAKLTRKKLKKLYPLADEDYLVAMVEGKVHVVNYIKLRKAEIEAEFEKYLKRIDNIFLAYLKKKKRSSFLPEDVSMVKTWKKQIKSILEEYLDWCYTVYANSVVEMYNYKKLYDLWMISKVSGAEEDVYEKPVVGEAKSDKRGVVDPTPTLTQKKLAAILGQETYGSTYPERSATALTNALNIADTSLKGITTGGSKDVTRYLTKLEKDMRKTVANRIANAAALGIEGTEEFSDYDVFTANPTYGGRFQRVEVLDRKTCLVCAKLDGAVYKQPVGRVHPNCRGVDVPISSDATKAAIKEMGSNKRRRESFDNWFEGLTEEQKRATLGKTKYDLYKAGKINVHDIVKQSRVVGAKDVTKIETYKEIPTLRTDLSIARDVVNSEAKKLPQRRIDRISTQEEINAYFRFIDKKEAIYMGLDSSALTRAGVSRNTLKAEVNRERRILRLKEKDLALQKKST